MAIHRPAGVVLPKAMGAMILDVQSQSRFQSQRRKAFFADVLAVLQGRSNDLVSFGAASAALHAYQQMPARTEMIRIDKIVGSVGRYKDFTRAFLPRTNVDIDRWKRLDVALARLETVPPIEVYQLGDAYFVRDGNHRVSVARANGIAEIEAQVTPIASRVPLSADLNPDAAEMLREYDQFLDQTELDRLRPGQRIYFSAPGHYRILLEHIAVHRYFMGLDLQRDIPYEEAVADWYDRVYEPIVAAIRRHRILEGFPRRTEADLYLWITDHHYYLSQKYGAGVSPEQAAEHFAEQFGGGAARRAVRAAFRGLREVVAGLRRRVEWLARRTPR